MKKILSSLLIFILPLLFLISCSKSEDKPTHTTINDASGLPFDPADPSATVNVTIRVSDTDNKAIDGAELVFMGTAYALAADATEHTLDSIPVKEAPSLVVRAPGYMTTQLNVNPMDSRDGISVVLLPMEATETFGNNVGGSVQARAGSVTFPADGMIDTATGSTYSGSATVDLRVSDVNRDYLDANGKIDVDASRLTTLTRDSSGNVKMSVQLATMDIQARGDLNENLQLDMANSKTAEVTMNISDKFTGELPGLTAGTTLPLSTLDETTGEWIETSACTLENDGGSLVCKGSVDTVGTVAVNYETCYGCVKAELSFAVPKDKTIVSRKYSLAEGYKVHTYNANGKVGVVALVPTDSTGKLKDSYELLSEYNLQTTSEMTDPVDPLAGTFYSQTDTVPLQKITTPLTGMEGDSLDALLNVCTMAATSITVTAPADVKVDMSEAVATPVDPLDFFLEDPVFPELVGTWASPCQNDGDPWYNDLKFVSVIDMFNRMHTSLIYYDSSNVSCSGNKTAEWKWVYSLSGGTASGITNESIAAVEINSLIYYQSVILHTDDLVSEWNSNSHFGISDWVKGQEIDVTGKNFDGSAAIYSTYYDLNWVNAEGDTSYGGLADATNNGSTEAKRPTSLNTSSPMYRQ